MTIFPFLCLEDSLLLLLLMTKFIGNRRRFTRRQILEKIGGTDVFSSMRRIRYARLCVCKQFIIINKSAS